MSMCESYRILWVVIDRCFGSIPFRYVVAAVADVRFSKLVHSLYIQNAVGTVAVSYHDVLKTLFWAHH